MNVTLTRAEFDSEGNITSAEAVVHYNVFGFRRSRPAFIRKSRSWYWMDDGTSIWQRDIRGILEGSLRLAIYKDQQARKENA